jgi:hypothetical protein
MPASAGAPAAAQTAPRQPAAAQGAPGAPAEAATAQSQVAQAPKSPSRVAPAAPTKPTAAPAPVETQAEAATKIGAAVPSPSAAPSGEASPAQLASGKPSEPGHASEPAHPNEPVHRNEAAHAGAALPDAGATRDAQAPPSAGAPSHEAAPAMVADPALAKPVIAQGAAPAAATLSAARPAAATASAVPTAAPSAAGAAPGPDVKAKIACQWIRVAGYAFCGPDADQPGYAGSPALQRLAAQLGRGNRAEPISAEEQQQDPTLALLAADREFILRAQTNFLLPVAEAYQRALRKAPQGFDAARGRANLALVYYGLGFAPELASEAASKSNPAAPVAAALLGDVLRETGLPDRASAAYGKAAAGGGLGACLAGRGLAGLALGSGDLDRALRGLASLGDVCPSSVVKDPGTELLRAQLQLASGDPSGALAALEPLQRYLSRRERGPLVETMGRAAQASGDLETARRAFEILASGDFGAAMGRQGRIELARLDAQSGQVDKGLRRLADLPLDQGAAARRDLMLEVSTGALSKGDDAKALSLINDEDLDPATLPAETQVRLAQSYRSMGFAEEGQRLLDHLVATGRRPLPAIVWQEVGANALARKDVSTALAAADALHDGGPQNAEAELSLRARALLAKGDVEQASAITAGPLETASPAAARELRLEIAARLVDSDPKAAAGLLDKALHAEGLPPLEGTRKAEALRGLGEAAEKSGDPRLALAMYQQLMVDFPALAAASGVPFRISLLTSRLQGGAAAAAAYDEAAKKSDPLSRRIAAAARNYDALMKQPQGAQEAR